MPATPRVRGWLGRFALVLATALLVLAAQPAQAQGLTGSGGSGAPLEIAADQGIEWRRDEQVYIARGNATASRGDVTVRADRLVAHYRDSGGGRDDGADTQQVLSTGGGTEIYRIEALGGVRITDPRARAEGDKAVYDLDQQVVVLTGQDLRFATDRETITAEDSLEYWQDRDLAVARGDAVATRADRRIAAEVLAARFSRADGAADDATGAGAGLADGQGARRIDRIEAFGGVEIATAQEYARGDRRIYNARTEVATLIGNVRLTRGDNQLNGGWGQVNLRTGVSRLLGAPPNSGAGQRVRALLQPDSADGLEVSETGQAEAEDNADDAADADTPEDADADAGSEADGADQE
jgi:lipopolysaccharide export system protein LptA